MTTYKLINKNLKTNKIEMTIDQIDSQLKLIEEGKNITAKDKNILCIVVELKEYIKEGKLQK